MTMLIASILEETADRVAARSAEAFDGGADVVEVRLDGLRTGESVEDLAKRLPVGQWLATCRPVHQGGLSREAAEHRAAILIRAARGGAGFIDFEFVDWERSSPARSDLLAILRDARVSAPALILSHHDFQGRPDDLHELAGRMHDVPEATAVKIAWPATSISDNFDAFDLWQEFPDRTIAICMGEAGQPSRTLAPKCNAYASYAAVAGDATVAPGQLTLDEMIGRFRFDKIDEATEVYGLIGNPVAQSAGSDLFNRVFAESKINAVYLPFLVGSTSEEFNAFIDGCRDREWLDVRGFSVTSPHKEHALEYIGEHVDPPADIIGAANTLRFEDGEVCGCNTDCDAAVETLMAELGDEDASLEDVPVDVLGAGGVARAMVAGLVDCGARVTIFNRDASRAQALADAFECDARPWEDRAAATGEILINCTSIGMQPDDAESPMPTDALRSGVMVMDSVYKPAETRLLREAAAAGGRCVRGVGMYVRQAAMQFEYWTQQMADVEQFAEIVSESLDARP